MNNRLEWLLAILVVVVVLVLLPVNAYVWPTPWLIIVTALLCAFIAGLFAFDFMQRRAKKASDIREAMQPVRREPDEEERHLKKTSVALFKKLYGVNLGEKEKRFARAIERSAFGKIYGMPLREKEKLLGRAIRKLAIEANAMAKHYPSREKHIAERVQKAVREAGDISVEELGRLKENARAFSLQDLQWYVDYMNDVFKIAKPLSKDEKKENLRILKDDDKWKEEIRRY